MVCRRPRCGEKILSDDVGDECSDNEGSDDDYDPSPDTGNKCNQSESHGSADDDGDQEKPAQTYNQPKRVKVAANNVTNRIVD
jgi:hypothetical protein